MSDVIKYRKCPICGKNAVHIAMSSQIVFHGDYQDLNGDETEYSEALLSTYTMYEDETVITQDIGIGVHACFECGYLEDVWVEEPRDLLIDAIYNLPAALRWLIVSYSKSTKWVMMRVYIARNRAKKRT